MMGRMEWCRKQTTGCGLNPGCCGVLCHWEYVGCEWVNRMFRISEDRYLTEYLCDWESFASGRNAVRWKQLEWGVLVLTGCLIYWFVAVLLSQQLTGLRWYLLELCTDCPVLCISEGSFLRRITFLEGKNQSSSSTPFLPLPKWNGKSENSDLVQVGKHQHCSECWQNLASHRAAAFFSPVTNRLEGRRVIDLAILWVLSKYSLLALTAVPAAESVPDIRNFIATPFNPNILSFHLQRGCPDMAKIVGCIFQMLLLHSSWVCQYIFNFLLASSPREHAMSNFLKHNISRKFILFCAS